MLHLTLGVLGGSCVEMMIHCLLASSRFHVQEPQAPMSPSEPLPFVRACVEHLGNSSEQNPGLKKLVGYWGDRCIKRE